MTRDEEKTKGQLLAEAREMRKRLAELEKTETARLEAEARIRHLNLVLRAIRSVNQLITKEKDRFTLLKGVCDNLMKNRGYYNAWIAIFDKSPDVMMSAEAGVGDRFSLLAERLNRGKLTDCAQKAVSQSGPIVTTDPASTCVDCPLSAAYAGRGAMTNRLEYEGIIYGVVSVSTPKDLSVNDEEQALFKEVAGDIAFALHNLELEEGRRKAEETLRESENRYRTIFETTGNATVIIEEDTTISLANKGFEKLSGFSKEEVEGRKCWTDFVTRESDLEKMKAYHHLRRRNPEAAPRNYDFKFIDRAGAVKDVLTTVGVIPGTKKSVGSFLDISEQKQAQEVVGRSEKRFRDLVENSLTGISIVQDGRMVYKNPEQERLFGPLARSFQFPECTGIHPDDVDNLRRCYQRMISDMVQTFETDFRLYPDPRTSDMRWIHCRAIKIEYQGKKALLVNMIDMTKVKQLEQLLQMQDKMTSLGHVAAGIAHEIRNPLSGINIYVSTLEKIYDRSDGLDKVKGILGELQSATGKIESVIKRVMDFSKPSEPKFMMTDINKPIEEAVSLSSVSLRKRGISVEKVLAEHLPPCQADPLLLEEVALNLINNAAEAMKNTDGAKKIEIRSSLENNRLIMRVSDSGPGIPLHLRDKVFDPFYSTKSGNSGIGLSICHRIVMDHSGSLEVIASKWGGAEFVIGIPIQTEKA